MQVELIKLLLGNFGVGSQYNRAKLCVLLILDICQFNQVLPGKKVDGEVD